MSLGFFILFIAIGITGAIVARKLTVWAALTGGLLAALVFLGTGWTGIAFMVAFFMLATAATSWKKVTKQEFVTEGEGGRRNAGQVLANAGVAGILGLLAAIVPSQHQLFLIMMAGAFSSATADTVSSEIGTVYGRKFYDVLSFRKGKRGADGVISMEGLLAGLAGSSVIAFIYAITHRFDATMIWVIVAGTIGNLADSYLGATLERKGILGNNAVNFFNTLIAALLMLIA